MILFTSQLVIFQTTQKKSDRGFYEEIDIIKFNASYGNDSIWTRRW